MTQEPRQEVEVHGRVGEPVALPLGPATDVQHPWALELPDGVEEAAGELCVSADRRGSYVVVATQSDPAGVPIAVLPVRITVA